MQLYLDSYGSTLKVKNQMFFVKPYGKDAKLFPVREIKSIFLTKGIMVSSDAMLLAIHSDIPVLIINGIGHPIGQIWGGQYGSIATIRKEQALLSTQKAGMLWIRNLLVQKLEQQRQLILRWSEQRSGIDVNIIDAGLRVIANMEQRFKRIAAADFDDNTTIAATFRGLEGTASRHYFSCMSACLPPKYQFSKRSSRPALNGFNALLNYLFGILYSQVHLALLKAGFDPYMGIFHADQYNRPTLVYDVIEIYRHWAEEVAMRLCTTDSLPPDAFIKPDDRTGIWISRSAKPIIVNTFFEFLDETITYKKLVRKRLTHIDLDAQRWANALKKNAK